MTSLLQLSEVSVPSPLDSSRVLVDCVNLEIRAGEVLGIIGPNGAGKSSLLKAIAGDLRYEGDMISAELRADPVSRARQVAMLPQLSLLNFPYRVYEVVELGRIPHRSGKERDHQIVNQALALMDIHFLKQRLYTELSGGEKQRVQLARVLAQIWDAGDAPNRAHLLLLDEPTTALDLGHQQILMNAINNFAAQGVAVVMVVHDINIAARYADRLLALLCSTPVAAGSVDEVVTADIMQRLFSTPVQVLRHPDGTHPIVIGMS